MELGLVVTRPDQPVGRAQVLTPSDTKLFAQEFHIPVTSPLTLKKDMPERVDLEKKLIEIKPDLAIVCDYGLIIPEGIFKIPRIGTFNIHFSRLPEFRGPSPVQATLLRGDPTAWITIFKLTNPPELEVKMDSGPILWQKEYPIKIDDTTQSLYTRLFEEVAKEIPIINFEGKLTEQDHSKATFTKFLTREDGFVEFSHLLELKTYSQFQACYPWPGIWTLRQAQGEPPKRMKILKCHPGEGKLVIDEIQFEGKSPQKTFASSSIFR
jgi:methionyl-tRNA formyltransferase